MGTTKNLALVAHDNKKQDLVEWAEFNCYSLIQHNLFCTGTTGKLIEEALLIRIQKVNPEVTSLANMTRLKSGPLGGDAQMGSLIATGVLDYLFFFTDPLTMQAHDTDIKALERLADVYNIPCASNRATADHIVSSPLFTIAYERKIYDYTAHNTRFDPNGRGFL